MRTALLDGDALEVVADTLALLLRNLFMLLEPGTRGEKQVPQRRIDKVGRNGGLQELLGHEHQAGLLDGHDAIADGRSRRTVEVLAPIERVHAIRDLRRKLGRSTNVLEPVLHVAQAEIPGPTAELCPPPIRIVLQVLENLMHGPVA